MISDFLWISQQISDFMNLYGYLGGEAGGLGEHVEVAGGEGQGHRLVHLNGHRLLLLHIYLHYIWTTPGPLRSNQTL